MRRTSGETILVADDYADTRSIIRWMLEERGYRVVEVTSGEEVLEAVRRERPGVILMDLAMPLVDGFTAIREVRADAELKRVPIIAMTAHDMARYRDQAQDAGCDYYITKPIDFSRLSVLIERLLEGTEQAKGRRG